MSSAKITWLGHATCLIETGTGKRIVFDPWLEGNPKCPQAFHQLDHIDWILLTHGHFDHIGSVAELAERTGAPVVANFEIASYLESQGVKNTVGMNKGGTVEQDGVLATMVHAVHSSGITTENGVVYGGEAAGFVVTLPNGFTLYHAGDTDVFGDMAQIRELYAPELALLPIGGHFTMGPKEAAYALGLLGVKTVIPIHYGTFPALTGNPDDLRRMIRDQSVRVEALEPGESYTVA